MKLILELYGKYPPIKIVLTNGEEINLIGQIDRIDEFEEWMKENI